MSNDHNEGQSSSKQSELVIAPPWIVSGSKGMDADAIGGPVPASLADPIDAPRRSVASPQRAEPPTSAGKLEGALEFRVVRPGAPVRRLRLTGHRYTFGSGQGCSIRLEDASLRPMHAVLLRDAHQILVRAYSVPLEHNGNRVAESTLRIGDIIRMGVYQFELLAAPLRPNDESGSAPQQDPTWVQSRSQLASRLTAASTADAQLPDQLAELTRQWRQRQAECESRESRCDDREFELHGRETELWNRAERLQQRENALRAQEAAALEIQQLHASTQQELEALLEREAEAQQTLQDREAELAKRTAELKEKQEELHRYQNEWEHREEEFAQRAAEASRQLEQTRDQARSANTTVESIRREFAELSEQLNDLRQRHQELQQREKQSAETMAQLSVEARTQQEELAGENDAAAAAAAQSRLTEIEDELRQVTEELESTRAEMAQLREDSLAKQRELQDKLSESGNALRAAREEAEQTRRIADAEQESASFRVAELEEQLAEAQQQHDRAVAEAETELHRLREEKATVQAENNNAQQVASELRDHIQELQESIDRANQETSQLRGDYEGATASIRQLELLIDQMKSGQASQQESWTNDSEQLRQSVEDLSVQLAQAHAELAELRSANEALTAELASAADSSASQDAPQSEITGEQWQTVQQELEGARNELERLQVDHQRTIQRLEDEHRESESELRREIEQLRQSISQSSSAADWVDNQTAEGTPAGENTSDAAAAAPNQEVDTPHVSATDASEPASTWNADTSQRDSDRGDQEQRSEAVVESDGAIWRMEAEQEVESGAHVEGWADVGSGQRDTTVDSRPWGSAWDQSEVNDTQQNTSEATSSWYQSDDAHSEPTDDVSWHDESPEDSVDSAIDHIQQGVQQAIDPVDERDEAWHADSEWSSPSSSQDSQGVADLEDHETIARLTNEYQDETPDSLDWSLFMPGGNVDGQQEDDEHLNETDADSLPVNSDAGEGLAAQLIEQIDAEDQHDAQDLSTDTQSHAEVEPTYVMDQQIEFDDQNFQDENSPEEVSQSESALSEAVARDPSFESTSSDAEISGEEDHADAWDEPTGAADAGDAAEGVADPIDAGGNDAELDDEEPREDDSIEAYMSRLLKRVQGDDSQSPVTESKAPVAEKKAPGVEAHPAETPQSEPGSNLNAAAESDVPEGSSAASASAETADRQVPDMELPPSVSDAIQNDAGPDALVPRSEAPERKRNLSAMRELANDSARNAVARSIRVQARDTQMKAIFRAVLASAWLVMATGVYAFVQWSSAIKLAMIGAFVVLFAVFLQEAYVLWRDARRRLMLAEETTSGSPEAVAQAVSALGEDDLALTADEQESAEPAEKA
ncbi:hypothetical protein FYK55_13555 [Roseiconus nitratireducens]|uniref:Uncharacterized protein n=1 Tax=Roseiconus nitratireducens TaxID=2605748 RepID=A0A5M6D4Z9_9BACT|nr:hypothetical protein [Roseiconus nitratireducens]KAA5542564.1 hypothetical protein FYK55_13555 [Roseiconus nitratireducens]